MDNFKQTLRFKNFVNLGFCILFCSFIVIVPLLTKLFETEQIADFIRGMATGLGTVFSVYTIIFAVKTVKAFRSEDELKKLYIQYNDERRQNIQLHIQAGIGILAIPLLVLSIVVSAFFSQTVALTLAGAAVVFSVIVFGFKLYYNNKF